MEHPEIIRQGWMPGNALHNFLVLLYHLVQIPLLLCTVLVAVLMLCGSLPFQLVWIAGGILTTSAVLDLVLLALLRWRKISYGWIQPPWILFASGRAILAIVIACLPLSGHGQLWVLGVVQGSLTLLACYAALVEPFWVQHTEVTVHLAGLHQPVDLLLLTDLHMERMTKREYDVLDVIARRRPDVVLLGGDLLNLSFVGDPQAIHHTRMFLQGIDPPAGGVFFVRGTLDVDPPAVVDRILQGLEVRKLESERVTLGNTQIQLIGIPAERSHGQLVTRLRELCHETPDLPQICLHHTPDLVEEAAACGIGLYLAGHTHGGQICLPLIGPLATASRFGRRYLRGRHEVGHTTAYVSRGLGLEGLGAPRMRFLARPELVWLHLLPRV